MPDSNGTFFLNMENGSTLKMNGMVHNNHTFRNGPENIKALSNSKMSLQSLRSNASSAASMGKVQMNGYASTQSLAEHEERVIYIVMEPSDRRFGFSVMGGLDEGFPPKIDNIAPGSPAERAGLNLDDEIIEVNGLKVEAVTHTEIIIQIHKCKKDITLKIRRYLNLSENDQHRNNNNVYNMVQGETSVIDGKYLPRNGSVRSSVNRESNVPSKFDNFAFQRDDDDDAEYSMDCANVEMDEQPKSLAFSQFVAMLGTMKQKMKTQRQQEHLNYLRNLLNKKHFQSAIKMHNRMTKIQVVKKNACKPVVINSKFLLSEVQHLLMESSDNTSTSLLAITNKTEFKELLNAHDHIASRESLYYLTDSDSDSESTIEGSQRVKFVRIDKTNDPLGATVRNEGDAVIISRIIKGGAAEKSGLLNVGDEIIEINKHSVRGKDVNEIVELLSELEGTLDFTLLPGSPTHKETLHEDDISVVKALYDYDPQNDDYLPCEELGLSFRKGDLIEILNKNDEDWWQAQFLEQEQRGLAGLIPSKKFQLQRELAKISLKGEDLEPILKEKKKCFCGRARRKGKKVPMKSMMSPVQESEVLTYEDMMRIYPEHNKKRPVVLIGPPQIGRREIREKLIGRFPDRFAAAVPHTTRAPTSDEVSSVDYTFVNRATFEKSIAAAEFIEHGLFDGHYYGTSFSAVRSVIQSGRTCLLNMHCQALPVLKSSNLLPYVVFITVPRVDQLKRLREFDDTGEPFNPNIRLKDKELDDVIEKARDMNRKYGHYFDRTIVNSDLDRAYNELLEICDFLETQPQWVPSSWVR
ncbi:protein PALS1-like [Hydractinia symbiolongicarpus]|uniref:protein PALS1-like n=1 Tax=Hydractinia symbiolongicarpus TaxID=13093 RepID=UPI00254CA100|nr:protein PALS1-like [Hydractinia symbiolongicarpus]